MARILDTIYSPDNLRHVPLHDLPALAGEVREEIIQTVSRNGDFLLTLTLLLNARPLLFVGLQLRGDV